ncbi:hypothetical protein Lnau_0324 [Legionella nautarum]|uniref:Uncharacterized protein n=1 Tax=Legionella nautarum TaxID=45070 RepID=A0A0W0X3G0_9GAMM|nr:hypothetical protein Lnau_0324 [Legionella nautarum]
MGVFCLIDNKPKAMNLIDTNIISDLTQMVELDLESLQVSITDELTGLTNRRGFIKLAGYLFQKSQEESAIFIKSGSYSKSRR